jgi:hypothetical protein
VRVCACMCVCVCVCVREKLHVTCRHVAHLTHQIVAVVVHKREAQGLSPQQRVPPKGTQRKGSTAKRGCKEEDCWLLWGRECCEWQRGGEGGRP